MHRSDSKKKKKKNIFCKGVADFFNKFLIEYFIINRRKFFRWVMTRLKKRSRVNFFGLQLEGLIIKIIKH